MLSKKTIQLTTDFFSISLHCSAELTSCLLLEIHIKKKHGVQLLQDKINHLILWISDDYFSLLTHRIRHINNRHHEITSMRDSFLMDTFCKYAWSSRKSSTKQHERRNTFSKGELFFQLISVKIKSQLFYVALHPFLRTTPSMKALSTLNCCLQCIYTICI